MDNNLNSGLLERLKEIEEKQKAVGVSKESTSKHEEEKTETPKHNETVLNLEDAENMDELGLSNDDLLNLIDEDEEIEEVTTEEEKEPVIEDTRTKAEIAAEKYAPIHIQPEAEKKKSDIPEMGSSLFDGIADMEKESQELSNKLAKEQEAYIEATKPVEAVGVEQTDSDNDEIDEIISSIGEIPIEKDEEEQDLDKLLEEYEASKVFSSIKESEMVTGPADYIIERDETYEEDIQNILERNDIVVVKKNSAERNAVLERFVNSGDKVTTTLINSGIFVTMSGAGATEIIAMNSLDGSQSESHNVLEKLNHVCQHIVGSSIGPMKLAQLIKVVSYWDIDSLYYAFFAASHPTVSEISRTCDRCGQEYFLNIHTRDLLINPEDFEKEITDIRDNVTTYQRLMETSELGKVYKKAHSNGMIIYYKHPSIESYLKTVGNLSDETKRIHSGLVDLAYGIDKIELRDRGNRFITITDPNEIINLISKFKNPDEKYEIFDMIESVTPNAKPVYGFKESVCPHCGHKNKLSTFNMESLLFTQAQLEEYEASLRWAAKAQKRNKNRKKSKNV